jgi:hypothetical protein
LRTVIATLWRDSVLDAKTNNGSPIPLQLDLGLCRVICQINGPALAVALPVSFAINQLVAIQPVAGSTPPNDTASELTCATVYAHADSSLELILGFANGALEYYTAPAADERPWKFTQSIPPRMGHAPSAGAGVTQVQWLARDIVLTAGADALLCLWRLFRQSVTSSPSWQLLHVFCAHTSLVVTAQLVPCGKHMWSLSANGELFQWTFTYNRAPTSLLALLPSFPQHSEHLSCAS